MSTRSEWLIERSRSLGGSDSPNILSGKIGVDFDHKFGSIHEIWSSKEPVRDRYNLPMPEEKNDPDKHRRMIQGSKSEKFCREYIGKVNEQSHQSVFKNFTGDPALSLCTEASTESFTTTVASWGLK